MKIRRTELPDVLVFTPRQYSDQRGFLSETYSRSRLRDAGIDVEFIQDNHSYSAARGTIRALHFQAPPHAQDKLIRVPRGAVFDVAVDLRSGSPTYGRWVSVEVSARQWNQVFIPAGFAHGFCTLEPDTEVLYKMSRPYVAEAEGGLLWDDPDLAIPWPAMDRYVMSEKDRSLPRFSGFVSPFQHDSRSPREGLS